MKKIHLIQLEIFFLVEAIQEALELKQKTKSEKKNLKSDSELEQEEKMKVEETVQIIKPKLKKILDSFKEG
jgi:hypothetical protein